MRTFRIQEVAAASYETSAPLTTNAEGETLVLAPPGQGDVFQGALNLALMSAGEKEKLCPSCEENEKRCVEVWKENGREEGWVMLEAEKGEVLFDADADADSDATEDDGQHQQEKEDRAAASAAEALLLLGREEARDEGSGWWDLGLLGLEDEDASAEMLSGAEGDDDDVLHGKPVKPFEVV